MSFNAKAEGLSMCGATFLAKKELVLSFQTLCGNVHLTFLQNDLPLSLEDVDLEARGQMTFQHEGCPRLL